MVMALARARPRSGRSVLAVTVARGHRAIEAPAHVEHVRPVRGARAHGALHVDPEVVALGHGDDLADDLRHIVGPDAAGVAAAHAGHGLREAARELPRAHGVVEEHAHVWRRLRRDGLPQGPGLAVTLQDKLDLWIGPDDPQQRLVRARPLQDGHVHAVHGGGVHLHAVETQALQLPHVVAVPAEHLVYARRAEVRSEPDRCRRRS
mmetsp:Transcript_22273/g.74956  ORF Transcript_22273/g.74956 Transcript_22273/m.74956 type:complete len:206 (+) Transcript_22273:54-671(+)